MSSKERKTYDKWIKTDILISTDSVEGPIMNIKINNYICSGLNELFSMVANFIFNGCDVTIGRIRMEGNDGREKNDLQNSSGQ